MFPSGNGKCRQAITIYFALTLFKFIMGTFFWLGENWVEAFLKGIGDLSVPVYLLLGISYLKSSNRVKQLTIYKGLLIGFLLSLFMDLHVLSLVDLFASWIPNQLPLFGWLLPFSMYLQLSLQYSSEFLPSSSFKSLIESEWGRSLLVKMALFLLLVTIGYVQRKTVKRLGSNLAHSFFKRTRTEVIYGIIIFFFAATLVAANPSTAEQGVYKEITQQQDLDLSVSVTPLEMGLNTITLDFKNGSKISNVKVELKCPLAGELKTMHLK